MRAPGALTMQRPIYNKQPIRVARLLCLIHRTWFQRHRDRVRLVRARIVKLPVNQNGDRNQRPLSVSAKLHNANRARLLAIFRFLVFLWPASPGNNLRPLLLAPTGNRGHPPQSEHHNDERPQSAI
jgi:hypothetical protein